MENGAQTSYHVCPLCEATCGLAIHTRGREVVGIRGDEADVFGEGFICPKGYSLKELDADPDRLRVPLLRRGGTLEPATWDEPSPRSTGASGRSSARRAATRWPSTSATRARTAWRSASTPRCCCARSARGTCTRPAPSIRCRSRWRRGSCSARC